MPSFIPWGGANGSYGFTPMLSDQELMQQAPSQIASATNQGISLANKLNSSAIQNQRNNQSALDQILAQIQGALQLQGPQLQSQMDLAQLNANSGLNQLKQQGANSMSLSKEDTGRELGLQELINSGSLGNTRLNNQGAIDLANINNQGSLSRVNAIAGPLFNALNGIFGGGGSGGFGLSGIQGSDGQSAFLPGGQGGFSSGQSYSPSPQAPAPVEPHAMPGGESITSGMSPAAMAQLRLHPSWQSPQTQRWMPLQQQRPGSHAVNTPTTHIA